MSKKQHAQDAFLNLNVAIRLIKNAELYMHKGNMPKIAELVREYRAGITVAALICEESTKNEQKKKVSR